MTDQEAIGLLKRALADVAPERSVEFADLTLDHHIKDLSLDSVSVMEMIGFLEEQVNRTFPDEELTKVTTLQDLAVLMRGERIKAS